MWGLSKITGLGLGIFAGLAGALAVLVSGVLDFFLLPDRWARRYGALGFLTGVPATVAVAVLRPPYAAVVLADRILTGTYNAAAERLTAAMPVTAAAMDAMSPIAAANNLSSLREKVSAALPSVPSAAATKP